MTKLRLGIDSMIRSLNSAGSAERQAPNVDLSPLIRIENIAATDGRLMGIIQAYCKDNKTRLIDMYVHYAADVVHRKAP